MFKSLPFFIGLRYFASHTHQWFVSFIVLASLLGIALGVCVLITVLSVMNGFNDEIENQIFKKAPHILVTNHDFTPKKANILDGYLKDLGVKASAPYFLDQGLLKSSDFLKPVIIHGIDPVLETKVSDIENSLEKGSLAKLKPGDFKLILSSTLAGELGVRPGDKMLVMTASIKVSPMGLLPRYKRFTVVDMFHGTTGLGIDNNYAIINIEDAKKLYQVTNRVTGVRVQTDSLYKAPLIANNLRDKLDDSFYVTDWTNQYGTHLRAVKLEKMMMLLVLSLLVVIAVFNLVSSLVMIVNEKRSDIAILRTMGTSGRTVLKIFIIQGTLVGLLGTILGVILGLLLSYNLTPVVDFILRLADLDGLLSTVYRVDSFPSRVLFSDVCLVSIISMLLSFLATIYPAWNASRLQPVEALRYE